MKLLSGFQLFVFTMVHFCVDLSCIYFLMCTVSVASADHTAWIGMAVLYNFLAFAFPVVWGTLTDKIDRCEIPAGIGCLLVSAGLLLNSCPSAGVVLIGLGNGLFHIGAGRKVLMNYSGKYAPCGIFIASGAIGVYLGNFWGGSHIVIHGIFPALMGVCSMIMIAIKELEKIKNNRTETSVKITTCSETVNSNQKPDCPGPAKCTRSASKNPESHSLSTLLPNNPDRSSTGTTLFIVFLILFAVVLIRSYYGSQTIYDWKTGFTMGLLFTLCIAAGKLLGGILADRIGVTVASTLSLAGAGILAFFSFQSPVCGMISILCFNMTMPLTLSLMHRTFENRPGFAFGVLMLALFLGTLPSMLWKNQTFVSPAGLAFLCAASLALMLSVIAVMKKIGKKL